MLHRALHRRRPGAAAFAGLLAVALLGGLASAHETDQYTLPPQREFADLGDHVTRRVYAAISAGVTATNAEIRQAIEKGQADQVARRQGPEEVAAAVRGDFPVALIMIEGLDKLPADPAVRLRYAGDLPGFKTNGSIRTAIEFPLNPLNAWTCGTTNLFGVYTGTDKMGHLCDMGWIYYRSYRKALKGGADTGAAVQAAIRLGTHDPVLSERGMLGYVTAGAYSNADLASNYMGLQFYRNLTEPVMLKGQVRPPLLEREGKYWKLAERVRPDSDFFSLFVSEHFDEALNPSLYLGMHRKPISRAIRKRRELILERRTDRHGNRRPASYFAAKAKELSTYWGEDYGHEGQPGDLLSLDRVLYSRLPPDAKLDDRGPYGYTPLHESAEDGDVTRVAHLLDEGTDPNVQVRSDEGRNADWGLTPLHLAARDGHGEVLHLLLSRGADVHRASDRGVMPLHMAIWSPEAARVLLDAGADLEARDERGRTVLHWAAFDPEAPIEVVDLLTDRGGDLNAADSLGQRPLHRAVAAGHDSAVTRLLAHGADVSAADRLGRTPLHLAAANGAEGIAAALIASGAAVDARDSFGCTPLHDAARRGDEAVVAVLLDAGAGPRTRDLYGGTPLHLAGRLGNSRIAGLLLAKGADAQGQAMGRGTPADEARRAGHAALAAMIETYRPEPAAVGESDVTAGHEASVVHQHTGTESP